MIVAGDSDYIPLAQRCKRLGRYVVGIGVAGATSSSLAAACDEFADYDTMPGINMSSASAGLVSGSSPTRSRSVHEVAFVAPVPVTGSAPITNTDAAAPEPAKSRAASRSADKDVDNDPSNDAGKDASQAEEERATPKVRKAATALLLRAMELLAKNDLEWQHASAVKNQMRRMDPSFQEQALGYRQFSDFLKSRHNVVELEQETPASPIMLRLRA